MVNRPKKKGTAFESLLVKLLKKRGFEASRLALTGASDQGDIAVSVGSTTIIIEAKHYSTVNRSLVKVWKAQAEREARNYSESTSKLSQPVLIVHRQNGSVMDSMVYLDNCLMMYLDDWLDTLEPLTKI